jgi:hypothetical protein
MGVMDDIKAEWEKMQEKPLRERVEYFMSYYKWYVVAFVAVLAIVATTLVGSLLKKEAVLSIVMLNSTNASSDSAFDDFSQRFLDIIGVDGKEFEVSITTNLTYRPEDNESLETNYTTVQTLAAQTAGALTDFIAGDLQTLQNLAYSGFFTDLSKVLSQEQMEKLSPYLCYVDMAVIEAIEKAAQAGNYELDLKIPDCKKPEEMEKPTAVLLDVSKTGWFEEIYTYTAKSTAIGVAVNAPHTQAILQLIDCLLLQQE